MSCCTVYAVNTIRALLSGILLMLYKHACYLVTILNGFINIFVVLFNYLLNIGSFAKEPGWHFFKINNKLFLELFKEF